MASSQRVQAYLEKHKIGHLFEELMGKVIADQPDDPIVYLIRSLERKASRQINVKKSTDYYGDGMSVPKDRAYDKPWQAKTKKVRPRSRSRSADRGKKGSSKPEWNHRTDTADTFDELWESKELDGRRTASSKRSASPSRKAATQSWADHQDDSLFTSHGYSGPRNINREEDPLAGEFAISKESSTSSQSEKTAKISIPKSRGQQQDAAKHKQQLQKVILGKKTAEDSGIEDDKDIDTQDDAVVLMENADDLRNEGVINVKSSKGVAVRTNVRQASGPDSEAVRVSICARCAKVMSGEPSVSAPGVGRYGELEDYDYDKNTSRPQSAVRFSPDSDEEFESVSQVTGPRRPVWQDDSDDESVTPRKGTHMFSSSTVPAKGRPMYSPDNQSNSSLKPVTAAHIAKSADFQQSVYKPGRGDPKTFNQTWSPQLDSSSDEEIGAAKHGSSTIVSGGGGGWKVYTDNEEDNASSFYGSPGMKGKKDVTGPY